MPTPRLALVLQESHTYVRLLSAIGKQETDILRGKHQDEYIQPGLTLSIITTQQMSAIWGTGLVRSRGSL